ncbi:MAG: type VI secretion system baseplate subunit TssK, partial [Anaerolineae bacterium]
WGIKLAEERHAPLELPSQTGLHYFRLLRADSVRMWERIKQEKSIAVRWEGIEASDFELTLYMTVPGGNS